jgi:hypothetical protein
MSFETQKNKVVIYQDSIVDSSLRIDKQENRNSIITDEIKKENQKDSSIKKLIDNSSEWTEFSVKTVNISQQYPLNLQYCNLIVEFDVFDKRLIPFINVSILFRQSDGTIDEEIPQDNIATMIVKEITPLEGETNFVRLKIVGNILVSYLITVHYYAKMVVNFYNPREYS